jgi:hypothetical protein
MTLIGLRDMKNCRYQPGRRMLLCLLAVLAAWGLEPRLTSAGVKVVQTISGEEALEHLQETNTVCGVIASTKYAEQSHGRPTYLNFDRPYPEQTFTAIVTESARPKFKVAPETAFNGKNVCVTGLITASSRGKPQIMIEDPSQIHIDDSAPPATNQTGQGAPR